MHRYPDYTRERLSRLSGLLWQKVYPESQPLASLLVSDRVNRISYSDAQKLESWRPAQIGDRFGPLFATYWFRGEVQVPKAWRGRRVDLIWASQSEATLWIDGESRQGLNSESGSPFNSISRRDAVLVRTAGGGETVSFQIEMACNRLGGYGAEIEMPAILKMSSPYVIERADIALFDEEAWILFHDYLVLQELEAEQLNDLDKTWGGRLLAELNRFANTYDADDRTTWKPARDILQALYASRNATTVHELSAIGHAHIDTAWLWTVAETARKCERSFSTAVTYMDDYPDYRFACSQAYQYDIIKQRNPLLYGRILAKVKAGQWVPVGGTWIEPDCNLPSGEALCRQFIYGQRFFQQEFGSFCREFWNPDVFGYNGQLPQIMRLAGITRFLTQKLSWNAFNKPHHHTFVWEGIDGSEVFTHFPPQDTYNSEAHVRELRESARKYKDHDRSAHGFLLFGYGDGGGGPTKRMLEVLRRAGDLQGLPRTKMRSSDEFFDLLEADNTDRARLVGELYFEYHRGTYTTQAATKKGNRKGESLLHDVEFLAAVAHRMLGNFYPAAEIDRLWKILLLNQFHDILPGSSIALVYEDAARDYNTITRDAEALAQAPIRSLVGSGTTTAVINTTGFARAEVISLSDGSPSFVQAPAYGVGQLAKADDQVYITETSQGDVILENCHLRATFARDGSLIGLVEKSTGREAMAGPGNLFLIHPDNPNQWDAWDIDPFHLEKETASLPAESCEIVERNPLRVGVVFIRSIGRQSSLRQVIQLSAHSRILEFKTEVDWQEDQTLLKVAFPVNVRAMNATYEMQFGCVERPTHFNTMYDLARYEVPGHKWADLSEPGFGVALLTESKYGFSTFGNMMRLSLLRAPTYPDPKADRGSHTFSYAILPHSGGWREAGVVAEGYKFNVPLRVVEDAQGNEMYSFASVDHPNLVLDTIKQSDQDTQALIFRLYESHGMRGTAKMKVATDFKTTTFVDLLEQEVQAANIDIEGLIMIPYRPFEIITLKLRGDIGREP